MPDAGKIVKRRGRTQSSFHINEFLFWKSAVKKWAPMLLQAKIVCQNRVMEMYRPRMHDNVIDSLEDNLVIRRKKSHLENSLLLDSNSPLPDFLARFSGCANGLLNCLATVKNMWCKMASCHTIVVQDN